MKKRIAVSSALAILMASSGLFAFDILNSEGEKTGLSISPTIHYRFNIDTTSDEAESTSTSASWVEEVDGDKQAKIEIGVGYEGDNYAFGVSITGEKKFAATDVDSTLGLGDAWGKFYFLDKQLWIRAGSLGNEWSFDTDPYSGNWGDDGPGLQFNVSPAAVKGLSVGFSLPVPGANTRKWYTVAGVDGPSYLYDKFTDAQKAAANATPSSGVMWGPGYLFQNAKFGLKLDGTIPNLKFSTEVSLKGVDSVKEEYFNGADTVIFAQYDIAPITIKAAAKIEDIGVSSGYKDTYNYDVDPQVFVGARLIVALPAVVDNLSLGSPFVQVKFEPDTTREAFKNTFIDFEWDPSYKIIPDRLDFLFWLGVGYKIYDAPTKVQEDYPLDFSVRPGLKVSFTPNANFIVRDRIYFARHTIEKGLKNSLQFLFECNF
ncbi:MAG: hypothetical protein LBJ41_01650 [Treponema sp.]|jgi:hypothetical protein|nr:hypothetical protein [Treponema sp.]